MCIVTVVSVCCVCFIVDHIPTQQQNELIFMEAFIMEILDKIPCNLILVY